jgi:hypothetical protein
MDLDALIAQLPGLKAEMERERELSRDAARRADTLERVIRGIESLVSPQSPTPTLFETVRSNGPSAASLIEDVLEAEQELRGIAAVRRVVHEQPGRVWRPRDVHAILEERGWVSPGSQAPIRGTEVAMHRMATRGELEKVGRGQFRIPPHEEVGQRD